MEPQPLAGTPESDRDNIWDARVAADMLQTNSSRLKVVAVKALMEEHASSEQHQRERNPQAPLPPSDAALPLRFWSGGPVITTNATRPSEAMALASAALVPATYSSQPGPVGQARVDPKLSFSVLPDGQTTIVRSNNAAERARVPTGSIFPTGAAPSDVPKVVTIADLPINPDMQNRMLQHALYQMDAPLDDWLRQRFTAIGFHDAPGHGLIPLPAMQGAWVGTAQPSAGLRRRKLDGTRDPSNRGWSAYPSPFDTGIPVHVPPMRVFTLQVRSQGAAGGVTRTRQQVQQRPSTAAGDGKLPIGPLLVDPLFMTNIAHAPSPAYAADVTRRAKTTAINDPARPKWLWFIRTNQTTINAHNTWGLDFYFASYA